MRCFDSARDSRDTILDHYTGVGEVLAVHALDRTFGLLHRQIRVKRGSLLSLDDVKNNDMIFVGSPAENLTLREIPVAGFRVSPPRLRAAPGRLATADGGAATAELLDRFLARLIDFVGLIVVDLIINGVIFAAISPPGGTGGIGYGGSFGAYSVVSSIILAAIYFGYFTFMESNQGKTVGKMVMKLHVEGATGGKPTLEEAAKRNLWVAYPILGMLPILGILGSLLALVAIIMIAVQINSDPEHGRGPTSSPALGWSRRAEIPVI